MAHVDERYSRIPVEDRLFSLVLALIATETGILKSDILSTVRGYAERYDPRGNNASLERQFERDKDDIRDLGIPLETIETPGMPGDNQTLRYRIPKEQYDFPADVKFTAGEIALLALAAEVWREASLSDDSQRALTKLRSLGVEPSDPVIGYAPRLRVRDTAFDPLRQALEKHHAVRFQYAKPGDSNPRPRHVNPLAMVFHENRWHLHAHDREINEPRTFLLSRIVGSVKMLPRETFIPPPSGLQDQVLSELEKRRLSNAAKLWVAPGSDAEVRLGKRAFERAEGIIRLHYTDDAIFADELAAFGPEVKILSPTKLRAEVRTRHSAVLAAHSNPPTRTGNQTGEPSAS